MMTCQKVFNSEEQRCDYCNGFSSARHRSLHYESECIIEFYKQEFTQKEGIRKYVGMDISNSSGWYYVHWFKKALELYGDVGWAGKFMSMRLLK